MPCASARRRGSAARGRARGSSFGGGVGVRGRPAVFVIGAVVDDRAHTGCGECFDIARPERAGGAQPGSELGEKRKRRHRAAPAKSPPRLAGGGRPVTRKIPYEKSG